MDGTGISLPRIERVPPIPEEERRADLARMIETAPDTGNGVWVFGYGSLMWDLRFAAAENRPAALAGHRRSFCHWTVSARGTPERPGLGLALVPGGGPCHGRAYRLDPASERENLEALWSREMNSGTYRTEWRQMATDEGAVWAVVFMANPEHTLYIEEPPLERAAAIIAGAEGRRGPNHQYLASTVREVRAMSRGDPEIEALHARVQSLLDS
jgi:cation transport protein ChaC